MGKGSKAKDYMGKLGENMPATMVLNRVKHMAVVLLVKHSKIFFLTLIQKRDLDNRNACWRLSGSNGANHYHSFWDCQEIRSYWEEIHKHLENVFKVRIPFNCETLDLGNLLLET